MPFVQPRTWDQIYPGLRVQVPWPKEALPDKYAVMPMREGVVGEGGRNFLLDGRPPAIQLPPLRSFLIWTDRT